MQTTGEFGMRIGGDFVVRTPGGFSANTQEAARDWNAKHTSPQFLGLSKCDTRVEGHPVFTCGNAKKIIIFYKHHLNSNDLLAV